MAGQVERSEDLEEDFQSFANENAEKDLDTGSLETTGQGGTDQVDASASSTTGLIGIKPGTLAEEVRRKKTFQKYGWDEINRYPKSYNLAEAGFYYKGGLNVFPYFHFYCYSPILAI